MNCPQCGVELSLEGAKFCQECGNALTHTGGQAEAATTIEVAVQPPIATPPPQPVQQAHTPAAEQVTPQPVQNAPAQQKVQQSQSTDINPRDKVYGIGGFLGTLLLLLIPIANIVLLIIWAVSGTVNRNKKNFAIAYLILLVIMIGIGIVFSTTFAALLTGLLNNAAY